MLDMITAVKDHMIEKLESTVGLGCEGAELHDHLLNQDYFIIGTHKAKEFIGNHAFDAINLIKEWEQDAMGEVHCDFSDPEKVANMFAYVVGEHILYSSRHLQDTVYEQGLTAADLNVIRSQINEGAWPQKVLDSLSTQFDQFYTGEVA